MREAPALEQALERGRVQSSTRGVAFCPSGEQRYYLDGARHFGSCRRTRCRASMHTLPSMLIAIVCVLSLLRWTEPGTACLGRCSRFRARMVRVAPS